MTLTRAKAAVDWLRPALPRGAGWRPDGELLGLFAAARDEAAFAELVRRHGPMVLGVCRRVTRDEHDAEDAFQDAFLVLARKAAALAAGCVLPGWLHGVAYHKALKARAAADRRRARERHLEELPHPSEEPDPVHREALAALDRELAALP
jgi:RNA polymerase sigma factor (sigma-70 family)